LRHLDQSNGMELTRAKLLKLNPCTEGLDWYDTKKETDLAKICEMLLEV